MSEQAPQSSLLGKIAAYTEILAKDPKSTIFVSLGEAYRKMGMLDDARLVVEKGLESNADFSPAHIVLARTLCQQGEYSLSETAFQDALKSDSESLAALVGYARLCILLGQEERARELLLEARNLSPADPVINKLLLSLPEEFPEDAGEAEDAGEDIVEEEATEMPEEFLQDEVEEDVDSSITSEEEVDTPVLVSSTLADLYLKQGLTAQALDVYRQLSAEEPDNLLFRRKIRDLEEDFPGLARKQEDVDTEIQEEPDSDELVDAIVEESSSDETSEEPVSLSEEEEIMQVSEFTAERNSSDSDGQVLSTLNRWLDSIQQRREDV